MDLQAHKESQAETSGDWWPNWKGEYCAIIASGPSTTKTDVEKLRGKLRVIAIKENYDLAPWCDVVYGCDAPWWKQRRGLPEFKGLKISFSARFPDVRNVEVLAKSDRLSQKPRVIGSGGNSGFQAVNLATQWGVQGILLIGFDMHDRGGVHWFGRVYATGRNNPGEDNFRRWRAAFQYESGILRVWGIDVVNASLTSSLVCFPKMSVDDALKRWSL